MGAMRSFSPEDYRTYLRYLARRAIPVQMQQRVDESDLVQEAMTNALENGDQFQGSSTEQYMAWLRTILVNVAANNREHHFAKRRSVIQELDKQFIDASAQLDDFIIAHHTSPSSAAGRNELAVQLCGGLDRLPSDQRTAIELKYLQKMSLQDVAAAMSRTEASVAGLLRRGLEFLRGEL